MTSHNRLIARIVGVPAGTAEGLREPIAKGALIWNDRKPRLQPPLELAADGITVSQMVLEDRDCLKIEPSRRRHPARSSGRYGAV